MPGTVRIFLPSQESQAIPLVSVASVAAGKAKRQTGGGPEERPQDSRDPGMCWDLPPLPPALTSPTSSPLCKDLGPGKAIRVLSSELSRGVSI